MLRKVGGYRYSGKFSTVQLSGDSREWLQGHDNRARLGLHEIMSRAVSPYRPSSKSWLVPACGGLAWLGLQPEAGPSKTLGARRGSDIY